MLPWPPVDRRWILSGVLVAGGVGLVRVLTHRPRLDSESKILVIGDSFANGMAPHFQALASEEGLPLMGGAINGTRIDQWLNSAWLQEKLATFEPTHVFISLGGNDAYSQLSPEDVGENTAELVELVQASGAHPIWIGVPPMPAVHLGNPINPETLMTVKRAAPFYFDASDLDIPRSPDGLHPTAAGYAGWAGTFWSWIS